jgi:transglutaminase-like putative cysteine protease
VTARLEILPRSAELRWVHDVFDNSVAIANLRRRGFGAVFRQHRHARASRAALSEDALEADAQTHPLPYPDDESLVGAARRRYPDPASIAGRRSSSNRRSSTRVMSMLRGMTLGIKEQLVYAPRGEQGAQAPGETLARGCGSCRDFALLMIEAVRSLGLAHASSSGYIFAPHLGRSAGATHAWTQSTCRARLG